MASINVCDYPGCGAVVGKSSDQLRMSFAWINMAALADALQSSGEVHLIERDPETLTKDLCRQHSLHVRGLVEKIFECAT